MCIGKLFGVEDCGDCPMAECPVDPTFAELLLEYDPMEHTDKFEEALKNALFTESSDTFI